MHLLEVKAIKVLYGKAIALNGLTLSIDEKRNGGSRRAERGGEEHASAGHFGHGSGGGGDLRSRESGSTVTLPMKSSARGSSIARNEGSCLWSLRSSRTWRWEPS